MLCLVVPGNIFYIDKQGVHNSLFPYLFVHIKKIFEAPTSPIKSSDTYNT